MSAIQIACPVCNAAPSEPCTAPTDTGRRNVAWFHFKREEAEPIGKRTPPAPPAYPYSSAEYCSFLKAMDVYYDTDPRSPLHHDQRCTLMFTN